MDCTMVAKVHEQETGGTNDALLYLCTHLVHLCRAKHVTMGYAWYCITVRKHTDTYGCM